MLTQREQFEAWFLLTEGPRAKYMLDQHTQGPFTGEYRDWQANNHWT